MALIRLDHVSKSYGDRVALSDVMLAFEPGEWAFVLGPSGAGKSTLLRILALAERPSSGRIEVDPYAIVGANEARVPGLVSAAAPSAEGGAEGAGETAASAAPAPPPPPSPRRKRISVRRVRRMVGVLGQEFRLLPDRTVYENIAIACQITGVWERGIIRERIVPLLEQMGIRGKESLFPDDLSAGEKQRVALARAMARLPKILIADEPTGNLDPVAAGQIFALLREISHRGTLVAVATHAEDWVRRYPGRTIRLERGLVRSDKREGDV
ncbi:MAG TPA: ATP-binding cassette domain-containing protein [Candidatus Eisenbacteria bacterium]|nr:ATP-binding cassette domain-containing protein [Candidatus Eisenbacteria bacterium]